MADIKLLPYGMLDSCSYLVSLSAASLLIDPAVKPEYLPTDCLPVRWIMATHGHIDHISEADSLREFLQAPLFMHETEKDYPPDPSRNLSQYIMQPMSLKRPEKLLGDDQIIELEEDYSIAIIHTPGHSPGSICLLLSLKNVPQALFSGDTLFAGSIGRTDLPGGNAQKMTESLRLLAGLDLPDLPVYPGHGPMTTLAGELKSNPYLRQVLS